MCAFCSFCLSHQSKKSSLNDEKVCVDLGMFVKFVNKPEKKNWTITLHQSMKGENMMVNLLKRL